MTSSQGRAAQWSSKANPRARSGIHGSSAPEGRRADAANLCDGFGEPVPEIVVRHVQIAQLVRRQHPRHSKAAHRACNNEERTTGVRVCLGKTQRRRRFEPASQRAFADGATKHGAAIKPTKNDSTAQHHKEAKSVPMRLRLRSSARMCQFTRSSTSAS